MPSTRKLGATASGKPKTPITFSLMRSAPASDKSGRPVYRSLTLTGDTTRGLSQEGVVRLRLPNNPANPVTLAQAIEREPRLQGERDKDENVARLLSMAQQLEGLYRHASTHAAGVVIGDRPLDALVPLYRDPRSDMPVTQ